MFGRSVSCYELDRLEKGQQKTRYQDRRIRKLCSELDARPPDFWWEWDLAAELKSDGAAENMTTLVHSGGPLAAPDGPRSRR